MHCARELIRRFKHDLYCEDQGIRCVTHILLLSPFVCTPSVVVVSRNNYMITSCERASAKIIFIINPSFLLSNWVFLSIDTHLCVNGIEQMLQKSNPVSNVCQKRCNRLNCTLHPHTHTYGEPPRTTVCVCTFTARAHTQQACYIHSIIWLIQFGSYQHGQ